MTATRTGYDEEVEMNLLRFDKGQVGVSVAPDSLWIHKALGGHFLQVQLQVHAAETDGLGQLFVLDVELVVRYGDSLTARMSTATANIAVAPGKIDRPTLRFPLTNAQVIAMEQNRIGDLAIQLEISAVAPQSAGYPGCSPITEHITVPESRWRQQLEGLGRSLAVEMSVPFPIEDEPRQEAVTWLRGAQLRLAGNDVDGAILDVRRTLEWIKDSSGWPEQLNKDKQARDQAERWSAIRAAISDQASGAPHKDQVTKTFSYTRQEAETLIALAAALLRVVP
jgi:hypothetical protein